jgi:hypothetical protein
MRTGLRSSSGFDASMKPEPKSPRLFQARPARRRYSSALERERCANELPRPARSVKKGPKRPHLNTTELIARSGETQINVFFEVPFRHCSKNHHSITSSARASSVSGTVRPSAFVVLRSITNSLFRRMTASPGPVEDLPS